MNFMFALLNAVANDQDSLSWQEVTDAKTTTNNTNIEDAIYQFTRDQLKTDASNLNNYINQHTKTLNGTQVNQKVLQRINELNTTYQKDSTNAQSIQNQADSMVQGSQTQAGQDGQNLSTKAQLAQTMTSILSTLASILMQRY